MVVGGYDVVPVVFSVAAARRFQFRTGLTNTVVVPGVVIRSSGNLPHCFRRIEVILQQTF